MCFYSKKRDKIVLPKTRVISRLPQHGTFSKCVLLIEKTWQNNFTKDPDQTGQKGHLTFTRTRFNCKMCVFSWKNLNLFFCRNHIQKRFSKVSLVRFYDHRKPLRNVLFIVKMKTTINYTSLLRCIIKFSVQEQMKKPLIFENAHNLVKHIASVFFYKKQWKLWKKTQRSFSVEG